MAEWDYDDGADYEIILGQTTGLLAQRGDGEAAALLVDVSAITLESTDEVVRTEKQYEGWTGNEYTVRIYRRAAVLDVEDHLVARFTDEVRSRIAETLRYVAERHGEENVEYVKVRPSLPVVDGDWRAAVAARLTADRPSNQARKGTGRSDLPVEDSLTFGSKEERRVYQALKRLQTFFPENETIAIAPLPGVRLRAGHTWEPDLLVMGHGKALVPEIDGPHHRGNRRYADDRNRDLQWQRCGVPSVRIPVEDLQDDAALEERLKEEVTRHLGP